MAEAVSTLPRRGWGETARRDAWWITPLAVFVGLGAFVVYSTWAAFQGVHYTFGPYLSPFYSPVTWFDPVRWPAGAEHAWFGAKPGWWPGVIPFSPALLILWAPGGLRLTCYYYRGAYYKAFWADPPSCAVGEPRKRYLGERSFPLILQNVHRYFLYLALVFLVILAYDVWRATWFATPDGGKEFGIGVGTLVLLVNVVLLGSFTFGCHSLRHLVGGRLTQLSAHPVQQQAYRCANCFNRRHMLFAWLSLFWVGFADLYVRLCSMGVWMDWRLF